MENDNLIKSIDSLIDDLFADEGEEVTKSMIKDQKPQKETADEAVSQAPKAEKDESRGAGRPKQISSIPQSDVDGNRSGDYDDDIADKNEDGRKKEDAQVEPPKEMKKSLSDAEFAEYQELKKAKAEAARTEELRKAQKEQTDLIKSAIQEATADIRSENESLRSMLNEQNDLIKSMANKPQRSKAVTSVQAVERFQKSESSLSKAELLDVAEDLVKSKQISMESAIELENNGFIYDPEVRGILEREVRRRYK